MDCHHDLDALFAQHQAALLRLRLDAAEASLNAYQTALLLHMGREEETILPLYRERGGERPGGGVDLFLFEHAKLKTQLDAIRQAMQALSNVPADRLEAPVLALLDRECTFKNLLMHHDTRERNMLYPRLDELTTGEERDALLARLL